MGIGFYLIFPPTCREMSIGYIFWNTVIIVALTLGCLAKSQTFWKNKRVIFWALLQWKVTKCSVSNHFSAHIWFDRIFAVIFSIVRSMLFWFFYFDFILIYFWDLLDFDLLIWNIRFFEVLSYFDRHVCAAFVAQWLVLSLSKRKIVGSNPPVVVHTPCRSPRLAPGNLANAR